MVETKDINWYIQDPNRLLQKEPFKRGRHSDRTYQINTEEVDINQTIQAELPSNPYNIISQREYMEEYDPSLHSIHKNKSIPTIAVKIGDNYAHIDRIVKASSLQKNIHAIHVLHLTANPMSFSLCGETDQKQNKIFSEYKELYAYKNMDKYRNSAVSKQKKVGDCGVLHYLKNGKYKVKVLSYDDGYVVIDNKDEDGDVISTSAYYTIGNIKIIDTYDDKYKYRFEWNDSNQEGIGKGWMLVSKIAHGFSRKPLQYRRGYVAWEFGQSSIEMFEIIDNLNAVVQKRFGQFAIYFKGKVDEETFQSDGTTLIINDPNPEEQGDMKVIEFPDPKGMLDYKKDILRDIQRQCSVTFIDPEMVKSGGDASSAAALLLTMKNDIALATQSASDWSDFADDYAFLVQEGFDLERSKNGEGNLGYFTQLKIKASFQVWTPESNATLISNLVQERGMGAISIKTLTEKAPHASPDEKERLAKEKEDTLQLEIEKTKRLNATKVVEEDITVNKAGDNINNNTQMQTK